MSSCSYFGCLLQHVCFVGYLGELLVFHLSALLNVIKVEKALLYICFFSPSKQTPCNKGKS